MDCISDKDFATSASATASSNDESAEKLVATNPLLSLTNITPEKIELTAIEQELMKVTDPFTSKLQLLSSIDIDAFFASERRYESARPSVESVYKLLQAHIAEDRMDRETQGYVRTLFMFILRVKMPSDGSGVVPDYTTGHFSLINTPTDDEVIRMLHKSIGRVVVGGRVSLSGNFVVLMKVGEAKNRSNQTFTTYKIVSRFLAEMAQRALELPASNNIYFKEVLPKSTKVLRVLDQSNSKFVIGHVSLGEVTTREMGGRRNKIRRTDEMQDVVDDAEFAPTLGTIVNCFINVILASKEE